MSYIHSYLKWRNLNEDTAKNKKAPDAILFIGDSHTVDNPGVSYSSLIKKNKPNVKIIAEGGKRTSWMVEQLLNELAKNKYAKVVIWGGNNDAFSQVSNSDAIYNIQQMVNMVNKQGGKAYVIVGYDQTVFSAPDKYKPTKYATVADMNKMREKYIRFQKDLSMMIDNAIIIPAFKINNSYSTDNIHGNTAAQKTVYEIVSQYLDSTEDTGKITIPGIENLTGSLDMDKVVKSISIELGSLVITPGMVDPVIALIQNSLKKLGYTKVEPNGKFDETTVDAIKQFQTKNKLTVTGNIDKETYIELDKQEEIDFSYSTAGILGQATDTATSAQAQNNYSSTQKLAFEQYVKSNKEEFKNKVIEISKEIGISPNWLMAVMYFESGLNPTAQNRSSRATGLIQWMPFTAKEYGTSVEAIGKMSNLEQLDLVRRYFAKWKGKLKSLTDTYLAVFYPTAIGKPDDYVLTSGKSASIITRSNPGFDRGGNNDGITTKREVGDWFVKTVQKNSGGANLA